DIVSHDDKNVRRSLSLLRECRDTCRHQGSKRCQQTEPDGPSHGHCRSVDCPRQNWNLRPTGTVTVRRKACATQHFAGKTSTPATVKINSSTTLPPLLRPFRWATFKGEPSNSKDDCSGAFWW